MANMSTQAKESPPTGQVNSLQPVCFFWGEAEGAGCQETLKKEVEGKPTLQCPSHYYYLGVLHLRNICFFFLAAIVM